MPNTETIPKEDFGLERWRAAAILAWLKEKKAEVGPCEFLIGTIRETLEAIEDLTSYDQYTFDADDPVCDRFLVLKIVKYVPDDDESEIDDVSWDTWHDLEHCKDEVESHVFADTRPNYENLCRVFDANTRQEIKWYEERYIEWGERPEV